MTVAAKVRKTEEQRERMRNNEKGGTEKKERENPGHERLRRKIKRAASLSFHEFPVPIGVYL